MIVPVGEHQYVLQDSGLVGRFPSHPRVPHKPTRAGNAGYIQSRSHWAHRSMSSSDPPRSPRLFLSRIYSCPTTSTQEGPLLWLEVTRVFQLSWGYAEGMDTQLSANLSIPNSDSTKAISRLRLTLNLFSSCQKMIAALSPTTFPG